LTDAANDATPLLRSGPAAHTHPVHAPAMSLDKNLFTLQFTPSADDTNVIDLVDPSGVVHYRKHRVQGATYEINVYGKTVQPYIPMFPQRSEAILTLLPFQTRYQDLC
jgi:hypothetical protein